MVTFNIVEGSSSDDFYPLYQKIKNDINNNMRVVDIRKKYKLSKSQWHKFHRALKENNIFYNKDYRQRYAKYYSYNKVNKKYIIYKKINDKQIFFCSCYKEEHAQKIVQKLKACNWDKKQIPRILKEVYDE